MHKFVAMSNIYYTNNLKGWGPMSPMKLNESLWEMLDRPADEDSEIDFDISLSEHLALMRQEEARG